MTYAAELQTIESHFSTNWAGATPIQFENDGAFEPPSDQAAFVRLFVLQGESENVGGRGKNIQKFRHPGVVQIDILSSEGRGTKPALDLADQASAIFRGKRVNDVIFRAPAIAKPAEGGGYYRVTVSVRYHRDENFNTS
jgi:hypothetical protein